MITVEEEIRNDLELTEPLARVRGTLAHFGMEGELGRLLQLWDEALAVSDFTAVAQHYPTFIGKVLHAIGGETRNVYLPEQWALDEGHRNLLRSAIAGTDPHSTDTNGDFDLEDAIAELGGLLETMDQFSEPESYLMARAMTPWPREHFDVEELASFDPILLYDFIFELDGFLANLLDSKSRWLWGVAVTRECLSRLPASGT